MQVKYLVSGGIGKKSTEILTDDTTGNGNETGNGWSLYRDLPYEVSDHCMAMLNSSTVAVIGGLKGTSAVLSKVFLMNLENPGLRKVII